MNDAAARLTAHGIPSILVDAFNAGSKVGAEPSPLDGDGLPMVEGLRRNIEALRKKSA